MHLSTRRRSDTLFNDIPCVVKFFHGENAKGVCDIRLHTLSSQFS